MKPLKFAIIMLAFIGFKAAAQRDEVKMMQSMYGMEKRDIIKKSMKLNAQESTNFWSVYDKYEEERKKLGAERIKIIEDYINLYSSLTEKQADDLAKRVLANDKDYDKLHMEYYNKMKHQVGAIKAATFMQIESYLQNAIALEVQENIPFVGDLQKSASK